MPSDVGVVSRESHQEVDEREDDEDTGGCSHQEHHLCVLDEVNAELFDLQLSLHQQVDLLGALREHEVEGVEVYTASVPLYFCCAADT